MSGREAFARPRPVDRIGRTLLIHALVIVLIGAAGGGLVVVLCATQDVWAIILLTMAAPFFVGSAQFVTYGPGLIERALWKQAQAGARWRRELMEFGLGFMAWGPGLGLVLGGLGGLLHGIACAVRFGGLPRGPLRRVRWAGMWALLPSWVLAPVVAALASPDDDRALAVAFVSVATTWNLFVMAAFVRAAHAHPLAAPPPLRCEACGYDLTGLPADRCPECGEWFPRRPPERG